MKLNPNLLFWASLILISLQGCGHTPVPKQNGYLRLDFEETKFKPSVHLLPFSFLQNQFSELQSSSVRPNQRGLTIFYPKLKAKIYLTYKEIDNNISDLLKDAQKLTQKHMIKADAISEKAYENKKNRVFGMNYTVEGNAASPIQFYITDSVNHFLHGALYFNTQPHYDSLYPAISYLQKDIKTLIESLVWKPKIKNL